MHARLFLEKADAHSNDPELGRTEYCMIFKNGKYGKPCGKWMINANDEPEAVGLKKLFGRLISHCRKHPYLKLVHLTLKGSPYVLLESTKRILPGEETMYDYGDRVTGLEDFMKHKNCIYFKMLQLNVEKWGIFYKMARRIELSAHVYNSV